MGAIRYRDIEVRGEVFPTVRAVAERFGVSGEAVRIAVRRGTQHRIGTGATGVEPMPVLICGIRFASARDAAAHYGVTPHAVYHAISDGDPDRIARPNFVWTEENNPKGRPFKVGGLSFPSMAAADRALGFGQGYVSRAVKTGSKVKWQRIVAAAMREVARQERKRRNGF